MTTIETSLGRPPFDPVSISPLSFWELSNEQREPAFKILRDERPVSWHPPVEGALIEPEVDGVWAVTRHEDVTYVSKNPDLFCSGEGVMIEALPEDVLEAVMSFLAMDGAEHSATRRLISSVFTPRQVAKIKDQIEHQAVTIVDGLLRTKDGDFVQQVSKRLPMWTVYEMIGLAPEKHEHGAHLADAIMGWNDAEVAGGREPGEILIDTLVGLLELSLDLTAERRAHPQEDLASLLVQAEVDGRRLTDEEIAAFFVLLSVAGNDTTRNTVSFVTMALQEFPEQRALLEKDYDGLIKPAMEEFVRWASPISTFRRTATQDTLLKGIEIKKGDWVLMMYGSANRDERAFPNPNTFDVTRSPNPHVAFGGGGPHYCMGAFLAKMQLEALHRQLIFRAPTLRVGKPTCMTSNFVRAVKSLPYTLG